MRHDMGEARLALRAGGATVLARGPAQDAGHCAASFIVSLLRPRHHHRARIPYRNTCDRIHVIRLPLPAQESPGRLGTPAANHPQQHRPAVLFFFPQMPVRIHMRVHDCLPQARECMHVSRTWHASSVFAEPSSPRLSANTLSSTSSRLSGCIVGAKNGVESTGPHRFRDLVHSTKALGTLAHDK